MIRQQSYMFHEKTSSDENSSISAKLPDNAVSIREKYAITRGQSLQHAELKTT